VQVNKIEGTAVARHGGNGRDHHVLGAGTHLAGFVGDAAAGDHDALLAEGLEQGVHTAQGLTETGDCLGRTGFWLGRVSGLDRIAGRALGRREKRELCRCERTA